MKKLLVILITVVASASAFGDAQTDFQSYWEKWIAVQTQFTQAMGYAETSTEAEKAAQNLLKDYQSLRDQLTKLETQYPCQKDEAYNADFLTAKSALYKKNSSTDPMYQISVIKFSKFVKKDASLQDIYKSLTEASQAMKKLNAAS